MTVDIQTEAVGVRQEMLEGRALEDAFSHACLVIANMRKHMKKCGEDKIALERKVNAQSQKLAVYEGGTRP